MYNIHIYLLICTSTACSRFFVAKVVPSRYMQAAQAKASVSVLMDKVNTMMSLLKKKPSSFMFEVNSKT